MYRGFVSHCVEDRHEANHPCLLDILPYLTKTAINPFLKFRLLGRTSLRFEFYFNYVPRALLTRLK